MKDFSRSDRLASQISRELSEILQLHANLPPNLMISIIGVELSKDLRFGKVFYSVYGPDDAEQKADEFFKGNGKKLRKELAGRIRIRYIPELDFRYDTSMQRGMRISELLDQIKKDDKEQH